MKLMLYVFCYIFCNPLVLVIVGASIPPTPKCLMSIVYFTLVGFSRICLLHKRVSHLYYFGDFFVIDFVNFTLSCFFVILLLLTRFALIARQFIVCPFYGNSCALVWALCSRVGFPFMCNSSIKFCLHCFSFCILLICLYKENYFPNNFVSVIYIFKVVFVLNYINRFCYVFHGCYVANTVKLLLTYFVRTFW